MIIAVDPGERHTGVATWDERGTSSVLCVTYEPWEAVDVVDQWLVSPVLEAVVVERWVLYPGQASAAAWRELVEAQCFGAIKYICERAGVLFVGQPSSILKPTRASLDSEGYQWVATDRDQKSAETHLQYWMRNRKG